MPIDYKKYASNWKTEIRPSILERAENRCEFCGVENYVVGYRDENGKFVVSADKNRKLFKIVLTVAHLNHDVSDNRPENLKALCQKCHLAYDAKERKRKRYNPLSGRLEFLKGKAENHD